MKLTVMYMCIEVSIVWYFFCFFIVFYIHIIKTCISDSVFTTRFWNADDQTIAKTNNLKVSVSKGAKRLNSIDNLVDMTIFWNNLKLLKLFGILTFLTRDVWFMTQFIWVVEINDCCLTRSKQLLNSIMARTSNVLMRWWPTCWFGFS